MQSGYLTFRPDNILTVGLIVAMVYLSAVLLAQIGMRAGLIRKIDDASARPAASR